MNTRKTVVWMAAAALLTAILNPPAVEARTRLVRLSTREAIVIRLAQPQAALVEEDRVLTLNEGLNQIDLAWQTVGIDPDSIRLTFLSHPDRVTLRSVSYPPGGSALVWEIHSVGAWEEKIRVTYLLSGIDHLVTHRVIVDGEERRASLDGHIVLRNFSGEDFDAARILPDIGDAFERGIRHEETLQMPLFSAADLPLTKIWFFDTALQPWDPAQQNHTVGIPVRYRIANQPAGGLGRFAIPAGKTRVFQRDGDSDTVFLGEDQVPLVPVGEKMEIHIGDSRDLVVTQRKIEAQKINVRRNHQNQTVLYDLTETLRAEIENFKDTPAVLTLIEHIPGQWEMQACNLPYRLKDAYTLELEIEIPPRGRRELVMTYQRRNLR